MRTSLLRLPFFAAALAAAAPGTQAAFNSAAVSDDARWVVYADLDALRTSAVGKQLIETAIKAQATKGLPIQVDVPKVLATIGSVTAYGSSFSREPKLVDGTAIFRGTADLPKIAEALLIQANLAHPEIVGEVKDLGFSAYSVGDPKGKSPTVVIAFPPEGEVLVSKSEEQLRRARSLLSGGGRSLADSPASPLRGLLGNAAHATFFTASVMPPKEFFPDNAPQTRILHMTTSASVALGEEGDKTFAHVELVASDDDTADKLTKILQGMTAMMSLAQSSDQQITDFLNSAVVDRKGETISLHLAYSSAKLADMIQKMTANAPAVARQARVHAGPGALERALGQRVFVWSQAGTIAAAGNAPAPGPAASPAPEWHAAPNPISLTNGATLSVRLLEKFGDNSVQFETVELTPEGGGNPLVFSRHLATDIRRPLLAGGGLESRGLQFGFPGEDGKYTLRVRFRASPSPHGQTGLEIWVKNPADSASGDVQQP